MPTRVVHFVPHTHWDREWYLPFQSFRARLVAMVDGLLEAMERDPRTRFTLDGQTATVDDYLEVRPEAEGRLRALVERGQLSIGPWHILMDEFLVSGETIVRNLELGVARATAMGGAMRVGYLPDMFGHIAQMPQILRQAGISDAVVWRGVPNAVDRHVFAWAAPDGSTVRCEYLYRGYGNARDLVERPAAIGERLAAYRELVGGFFGDDDLLAMYGEDHSIPDADYSDRIAAYNARGEGSRLVVETLAEYLAATRERSLPGPTWEGELRSGARANILMGVTSHHGDVRAAAARAERTLERLAEPIAALHGAHWPARELELAWRRVIEDSAHDSICACSADEVVAQVLVRFAEAEQIGRALVDESLAAVGAHQPAGARVAVNPSPVEREDLVEVTFGEGEGGAAGLVSAVGPNRVVLVAQELERRAAVLEDVEMPAGEVAAYLRVRLHGRELYRHYVVSWVHEPGEPPSLRLVAEPEPRPTDFDVEGMLRELARLADGEPGSSWHLRVDVVPQRRALVRARVPALGWSGLHVTTSTRRAKAGSPADAVRTTAGRLWNDRLSVGAEEDGTLTIEGGGVRLDGVGRLVDGGDVGDAYDFGPPTHDSLVGTPVAVRVEAGEPGPLRGGISIVRRYRWPAGLLADLSGRAAETREVTVRMEVELRAGEPFVRLRLRFDNPSVDHRLRFHIPLPAPVSGSFAEGQFAVVERGLTMEGGHGEHPLPTFPAHGFASVDGVAVLLPQVMEYEVVDDGRELALTLLRATGRISRDDHPWRAEPAGPTLETPSAQRLGPNDVSFALMPHAGPPDASVLASLEHYRLPLLAVRATGAPDLALAATEGLRVEGEGVVLSALRRRGEMLEARVVNETPEAVGAVLHGAFRAAREADLLGSAARRLPVDGGSVRLTLGPWQILTVLLSRPSPAARRGDARAGRRRR